LLDHGQPPPRLAHRGEHRLGRALAVEPGRDQRRKARHALAARKRHHPLDRLIGRETHDVDTLPGDALVVRKRDHRHLGAARDRRCGAHLFGEQRAKDQPVTLGNRALCRRRGAPGTRAIVDRDADRSIAAVDQREVGGVGDRLADRAVGTAGRNDHRDQIATRIDRYDRNRVDAPGTRRARAARSGLAPGQRQRCSQAHHEKTAPRLP